MDIVSVFVDKTNAVFCCVVHSLHLCNYNTMTDWKNCNIRILFGFMMSSILNTSKFVPNTQQSIVCTLTHFKWNLNNKLSSNQHSTQLNQRTIFNLQINTGIRIPRPRPQKIPRRLRFRPRPPHPQILPLPTSNRGSILPSPPCFAPWSQTAKSINQSRGAFETGGFWIGQGVWDTREELYAWSCHVVVQSAGYFDGVEEIQYSRGYLECGVYLCGNEQWAALV